jgi:high-affinity iron transporter
MSRIAWIVALLGFGPAARGGDVVGRVEMPAACSPGVSPAVVRLEPKSATVAAPVAPARAAVRLEVHQKHLQFQPRVRGARVGQTLFFTNGDQEPHNVHVVGPGLNFSRTISPGESVELTPAKPGLLKLLCDIHIHMRGYVVVSDSPWVAACDREGRFRLADVPPGPYRLHVWHELGDPLAADIEVGSDGLDLGVLTVSGPAAGSGGRMAAKVVPWPDVIDAISLECATALDIATRKGGEAAVRAVGRIDDAYLGTFEASDMETAVRTALGYGRTIAIEQRFRALRRQARAVADGAEEPAKMAGTIRALLSDLVQAARDLQTAGIADRSGVLAGPAAAAPADGVANRGEMESRIVELRRALSRVADLVQQGAPREAAAEVVTAYFEAFEPIEQVLNVRNPSSVRPLETRFATLRGRIEGGLRGAELDAELAALAGDVQAAIDRGEASNRSAFGLGFVASLGTILREGVEVILLLTMLAALVGRAGRPRGAVAALWWGVALAVVASAATAVGLNTLVSGARGRARELVEGLVMLTASGVLFYVSYWLVSQAESRRWLDFLKRQAQRGASAGGFFALGLAAFLAVYREGAETALMYQALLTGQPREGVAGVACGLAVGLVVLAAIAFVLRATSLRLPMRAFFQATSALLFALAVVFAGQGVLELQVAGALKTTPISWLGRGVPMLGLHPTLQCVAVQGILVAGALAALVVLKWNTTRPEQSQDRPRASQAPAPTALAAARHGS